VSPKLYGRISTWLADISLKSTAYKIVVTDGKMTEEQTANKQQPDGFGGLSKTCYPIRNEVCQNLLREASHQAIQEANVPANI